MFAFKRILATTLFLSCLVSGQPVAAEAPKDFSVSTADGSATFTLMKAGGKYVALHFLLKTECPICQRHVFDYAKGGARLPQVEQVFLKPDAEPAIKTWEAKLKEKYGITPPPIYRDEDAKLAKAFAVPDGYKFHGEVVHYPALILLGPDGKEVFRHVGKDNKDRYTLDQLVAKIEDLKPPPHQSRK